MASAAASCSSRNIQRRRSPACTASTLIYSRPSFTKTIHPLASSSLPKTIIVLRREKCLLLKNTNALSSCEANSLSNARLIFREETLGIHVFSEDSGAWYGCRGGTSFVPPVVTGFCRGVLSREFFEKVFKSSESTSACPATASHFPTSFKSFTVSFGTCSSLTGFCALRGSFHMAGDIMGLAKVPISVESKAPAKRTCLISEIVGYFNGNSM
mmetsp:Transcript_31615/g.122415  ORF Transcript_31615/g.122415 Transcript_31615/m.122415 type:complete len:213 (+) Transcript_31615:217-855(+)